MEFDETENGETFTYTVCAVCSIDAPNPETARRYFADDIQNGNIECDVNPEYVFGLDVREIGAALAALRYWQANGAPDFHGIASNLESFAPLDDSEVDELCERLNT